MSVNEAPEKWPRFKVDSLGILRMNERLYVFYVDEIRQGVFDRESSFATYDTS